MFAACAGDAGDAGDACAACADDADDAGDADDADGDHEKRVDGFRDARLKLVSASGRAAEVAAVARKTVVEAPARGAQLIPVRERCSTWRGSGSRRYSADNCALHKTGEHRAFFGEFLVVNFFGACIEISTSVPNLVAFGYMYMN